MTKLMINQRYCQDCGARPVQVRMQCCGMEMCNVCGGQLAWHSRNDSDPMWPTQARELDAVACEA